ncbi:Amino acid transporter [Theobroma cacao]|nr:Amino acid transporter [Theobroma cacao]
MANELRTPLTQTTTGSSFIKACFNGTNAFLGIDLLTVPYALASGGWLSLFFFFLIGIMTFYTGILLKKCMGANPSIKSYLDIAEHAFGKKGRILVMIITNSELYLVAIGLLILEGDNLHKLFPKLMVKLGTILVDGRQSFVVLTALVILPSMLLTGLSILSYVSTTGVFSCLLIFGSTLCVGAISGVGFNAKGNLLNMNGIPTAVSFFVLTTITYASTAMVGYLMYGDGVESQITLNLPTREVAAKVAIYTTLLMPVTRYALMVTPVATAIEGGLSENLINWRAVKLFIKIALLVSTTIVAFVFPYFENLMAIVGSIFVVLGSLVLPCLWYLKASGSYQSWSCKLICIVGIIVFGTTAGVLGTYSSISELVHDM